MSMFANQLSASPADIQRKREIAQRLLMNAQQTQPQTIGEGLGAVGDYIYAGRVGKAASVQDALLQDQAAGYFSGGGAPSTATPQQTGMMPENVDVGYLPPQGQVIPELGAGKGTGGTINAPQQPQQQDETAGRFYMTDVTDDELFETLQDPVAVRALEYAAPEKLATAREEAKLRMEYRQNAPKREMEQLQLQKMRRELNAGADAPTVQKVTQSDGSEVLVQWDGQQWVPLNAPQGGRAVGDRQKLTENQSKLELFNNMQAETSPVLLDLEKQFDPANVPDAAARLLPGGNFWASREAQVYNTAAAAWAEGALRIATGAAATQPEIERTVRTYFAQPGDDPVTVKFKAQMREMYLRSIQRGLGYKPDGQLITPSEFAGGMQQQERGGGLQPGVVEDGYRYKGGNPADPNSWEKVL